MLLAHFLLASALLVSAFAARDKDRVDHLPGLARQPDFKHYAGYLQATGTKKLFYWFVESERNPAQDPVVLWLNGGPGCSSLTGFLVELGPWRLNKAGDELSWFDQRWNKIANIIFLESPQCVGYSYAEDGRCDSGDDQSAIDNHAALRDFFAGWPEYRDNEFYIAGESYAGFYVPLLSALVVDDSDFNFKGFAVGNAVTDREMMANGLVYFTYARGVFGNELWRGLVAECCVNGNSSDCQFYNNPNTQCQILRAEVHSLVWSRGLNPYSLYEDCHGGVPNHLGIIRETDHVIEFMTPDEMSLTKQQFETMLDNVRRLPGDKELRSRIPCTDTSNRERYLNNPAVRAALHVPDSVPAWQPCSSNVSREYERQYTKMYDQYHKVLNKGHRVLVFNGDFDMACDHLSDYWFVEELGLEGVEGYRDWQYEHEDGSTQIAGFVQTYRNLTYLTVKGAGHFVPTDKPVPAYKMFSNYIHGEPFK